MREDRAVGTRSDPVLLTKKLSEASVYKNKISIKIPIEILGEKDNSKATKYRNAELELKSTPITMTPSRPNLFMERMESTSRYGQYAKNFNKILD